LRAVVITPTTGLPELSQAIQSVARQGDEVEHWVVVDGVQYAEKAIKIVQDNQHKNLKLIVLPENTGMPQNHFWGKLESGFYGHRIYASVAGLINADCVLFLDEDNWFEDPHVKSMLIGIKDHEFEWCYSLRKIVDKEGNFICTDDCDSLGIFPNQTNINFVDMNCYCFKTEFLLKLQSTFYRDTYNCDREVYKQAFGLSKSPSSFGGTGAYTVNYRCTKDFQKEWFLSGNNKMQNLYKTFPWRAK
jgi:glycosyltransferase involved in cell wall biosynthesis